ncbi:AAA domain-containing protein [Kutzneria kofuensis]|uniref:Very-short-patch-repair endonuclease n=1 Tax=Kutzneria kofuensis TaxID=103725 RepID=A0A7W9NLN5_9PSEU|nr:AAA domain-containing protein [Kutzneria kofuensis]MBB5896676.1 very-short-patch-repair endonuclease [Kutzneria kofuensis]
MTTSFASRLDVVRVKADQWADELIDLGHQNTLLHYQDTKTITLDLTSASADSLGQLLGGRKTKLSALLPAKDAHAAACIRARNLRRKMLQLEEEQGVEVGRVARGLLRLPPPTTRGTSPVPPLRAPLVLQAIAIDSRTAAENDFTIDLVGDAEVNPVLLYALNRQYGVDLDLDRTQEHLNGLLDEADDPAEQVRRLFGAIEDLLGQQSLTAELEERVLAGIFSFENLPMVKDLKAATDLLASHDVIAAAAGFAPAIDGLQAVAAAHRTGSPDSVQPKDEFLVLDADSSQQQALFAVLSGQHVVIQGPPGTGKSQTIANIIASAVAAGKRILFVTEKRAAIEAVTERLQQVDLHHLVLDLHQQTLGRRQVAEQVAESLERASKELPPQVNGLHDRLAERRRQVIQHDHELHSPRAPWGISAYQAYSAMLDLPAASRIGHVLRGSQLNALSGDTLNRVENDLVNFVSMGGLAVRRGDLPWSRCEIRNMRDVEEVHAKLTELHARSWRNAQSELRALVGRAGLRKASDLAGWQDILGLLGAVEKTVSYYGEEIFSAPLEDFCFATGDRAWRARHPRQLGWWARRGVRKQIRMMRKVGKCDRGRMHEELLAASWQLNRWRQLALEGAVPAAVLGLGEVLGRFTEVRDQLAAVAMCARIEEPEQLPEEKISSTLDELTGDVNTLYRMPRLNTITDQLEALGLGQLLDELVERDADADEALRMLRSCWYSSLLHEFKLRVPYLAQFTGTQHDRIVAEFRQADTDHFRLNAQRIRRGVAERLAAARDSNRQQSALVLGEAKRKRGHMPIRKLVAKAPDVLLAARPCWAMSPIVVSRLLPAQRLFDLVVFDEASQIEPYDAMAAIMRGEQLVVAGDDKQLPPTMFFRQTLRGGAGEDDEDDEQQAVTPQVGDFESILKCLAALIPRTYTLKWHYRSADERLIAFSNHEIYGDQLVTFPGRDEKSPLRHEVVDGIAAPGTGGAADEEISRVVDLVLEHVRQHPEDTLGVITMNIKNADRIEGALRQAGQRHPELAEFTARMQGPGKRLFVKSLERVQGDERDAIILSIGFSKGADGRLPMGFGPLNHDGGERRLNVAVTRARHRMCVVSAFTHHDMAPNWHKEGPRLLRKFLEFAAGGGGPADIGRADAQPLNGFERSIHEALLAANVPVVPQWGVSGYRIDFALIHPERPGLMVLAVEADGERYHLSESARDRDRLRQDHLERLGWRFHRVWASEWFSDPEQQTARIVERWREAVADADRQPDPVPPTVERVEVPVPKVERGPRPRVPRRAKIDEYGPAELIAIARWVLSDGLALDRETRIEQVREALGFQRRGKRIVERVSIALDEVEKSAAGEGN